MSDLLKITLTKEMQAKMLARAQAKRTPVDELPEVKKVISKSLELFLARTNQKRTVNIESLPVHKVEPKVAAFVDVEDKPEDDSAYAFPDAVEPARESDSETVDFDAPEDSVEALVSADPSARHIYLGIPAESDSGLLHTDIVLDESQERAIDNLVGEQYGCLIGAAGTGKTTTTKALVKRLIYGADSTFKPRKVGVNLNIAFVAYTGMATQVIKENLPTWLHGSVMTIHSLLEFQPEESRWQNPKTGEWKVSMPFLPQRHEMNPLDYDMVILDEASMLGMDLWNQFRVACKPGTRIIFIGDLNQLPPIIGESIFAYALTSWKVSELTHIHRQKGPGANRIIETAHAILNGKMFEFDKLQGNPDWRVSGAKLNAKARIASKEILQTLGWLKNQKHENGRAYYEPYLDRVMTAGNGFDDMRESSLVQQAPLNESLSLMIQPSTRENPRIIIDAGKDGTKYFGVGHRVMALKNEPPSKKGRVTNGMTGIIKSIKANPEYSGNPHKFGSEFDIEDYQRKAFKAMTGVDDEETREDRIAAAEAAVYEFDLDSISTSLAERLAQADVDADAESLQKNDKEAWSSHTVEVEFMNGETRVYWSKVQVGAISLAYASTVAKCQGSQFPTAIIIVHDAVKQQLNREWLYTAVTRAQGHVIILYTDFALRVCLNKQAIFGNTLEEKIHKYAQFLDGTRVSGLDKLQKKEVILEAGPYLNSYRSAREI